MTIILALLFALAGYVFIQAGANDTTPGAYLRQVLG